jgi:DNA primase RepB-like protein
VASCWSRVSVTRTEIYLDRNPLRSGRHRRTREGPDAARHLCMDLDTDRDVRLTALRASDALPTPITFISTFLGIPKGLWRVDGCPIGPQKSALNLLAIGIGSDPTRTDCNRVLRLPGFLNCKYDPAYPVTIEYPGDSTWNFDDFRLDILASDAILSSRTFTARKHPSDLTNPEHDWSWVLHEHARGKDAARLTRKLTSRRADKRNSLYHAQRTADVASARLRFGKSIPIDDVVMLLEVRRRLEIPLATLSRSCAEAHSLCAGGEGIMLDSISCQSNNGASHRKNCDTPPLRGNCRETCERSRGTILASDRWRIPGFLEETCVYLRKTRVSGGLSDVAAR